MSAPTAPPAPPGETPEAARPAPEAAAAPPSAQVRPPAGPSLLHALSEHFLLRDARAAATSLTDETRGALARALARSAQKRAAARTLWEAGAKAEAVSLGVAALEVVTTTTDASTLPAPLQVAARQLAEARRLLDERRAEAGRLPELDAEVTRKDARLLDELLDRLEGLEGALAPAAMTERGRARLRLGRWARALGVVSLALVGGYFALRTPRTLRADATAAYNAKYAASNAVDGKPETEWCLPDRAQGTLTVHVIPARKVSRVRLLNIHNPPFNDRATKDYRVQVHYKGQVVRSFDGIFAEFTDLPAWKAFEVSAVADRVTVEVLSWHKDGGGVAEVDVD